MHEIQLRNVLNDQTIPDIYHELVVAIQHNRDNDMFWATKAYCCHYVAKKKWNNKHKLPKLQKTNKKEMLSIAEIYYRAYSLAVRLEEAQIHYAEEYRHSSIWFAHILNEFSLSGDTIENSTKKLYIDHLRTKIQALRNHENPYCPISDPHAWKLIESSFKLLENSDNGGDFYKTSRNHWKHFLKAMELRIN